MSEVANKRPGLASPRARNPLIAVPPGAAPTGESDASFDVPLEAIVFRPRKWLSGLSTEGSHVLGDIGGFAVDDGDEVLRACRPSVDSVDGTQRRFWVAPPQGEQGDISAEFGESLESASVMVENDWSMDSGSEGLYTLATTGSCLPCRSDLSLQTTQVEASGQLCANAMRPPSPTPPLLGSALAGGALPLFGGTVGTPPSARRTVAHADHPQPRLIAGHSSAPQMPVQSSSDSRGGTRLRAPSPNVSGRSSSVGPRRFDQQPSSGSRARSPKTNSRSGTPLVTRSRSATPSGGPKRLSTGSRVAATSSTSTSTAERRRLPQRASRERGEVRAGLGSPRQSERFSNTETGRRARSVSPEDAEDGHATGNGAIGRRSCGTRTSAKALETSVLEADNHQLRLEVSELRGELRGVLRELQARTQDLRQISTLLARRSNHSVALSNPSTSNLRDGLGDGRTGSGVQLSGICAEALVSRDSRIARLEVENEQYRRLESDYRAKFASQERMLFELQSQVQAQNRELSFVSSQALNQSMVGEVATDNGRGHSGVVVAPSATSNAVVRGKLAVAPNMSRASPRCLSHGVGGTAPGMVVKEATLMPQVHSDGSLSRTPPPTPSPRVDGRMLR